MIRKMHGTISAAKVSGVGLLLSVEIAQDDPLLLAWARAGWGSTLGLIRPAARRT